MPSSTASTKTERSERRAAKAGLVYVNSTEGGITRQRCGKGFTFKTPSGRTLRSQPTRRRIESLVIPPAWDDVYICPHADGHIQAAGTDEAGRRQYIYHERWQAISTANKFDRMHLFGKKLPRIRRRLRKDLNRRKLARPRVLAAVVRLLDRVQLRVGNRAYAENNGAHGATTLSTDHVDIDKARVRLDFPGKGGRRREIDFSDRKVAEVVRQCEEIDGQFLFQYLDEDGQSHSIDSSDVNEYLREISGEDVTAKDFRTWWGSTVALSALSSIEPDDSAAACRRKIAAAVQATADALANTKAVCRSSYVHPGLIAAAESGELPKLTAKLPTESKREMTIEETRFLAILPHLDFT